MKIIGLGIVIFIEKSNMSIIRDFFGQIFYEISIKNITCFIDIYSVVLEYLGVLPSSYGYKRMLTCFNLIINLNLLAL